MLSSIGPGEECRPAPVQALRGGIACAAAKRRQSPRPRVNPNPRNPPSTSGPDPAEQRSEHPPPSPQPRRRVRPVKEPASASPICVVSKPSVKQAVKRGNAVSSTLNV